MMQEQKEYMDMEFVKIFTVLVTLFYYVHYFSVKLATFIFGDL